MTSLRWVVSAVLAGCLAAGSALAQDQPRVLMDMDTILHQPGTFGNDKTPVGTVELVPGKFGQACKFSFVANASGGFFTKWLKGTPEWDQAAGLSFWVKGDGSDSWGGLEMIDADNYTLRYGYCFPVNSTDWRKIVVPWRDLIPELPAGKPVDPKAGYPPSHFANLWFGKWYYWRDYPAHSFTIDQIALEPTVPPPPAPALPAKAGVPRLLEKLKAKQPVTIVTMGDSLSDKAHWANRQTLWSELLVSKLKETYGSEVTLVNPAIGGTQLTQNLILMPRWLATTPKPDLVTVWFGFNDWDSGMRGEHFAEMLRIAVDRIRAMTGGAEVLLMTTCPAVARWDTMNELADAVRAVAAEKRTGLADVAAAFHAAAPDEATRPSLYCDDRTHLGAKGHTLVAETVAKAVSASE